MTIGRNFQASGAGHFPTAASHASGHMLFDSAASTRSELALESDKKTAEGTVRPDPTFHQPDPQSLPTRHKLNGEVYTFTPASSTSVTPDDAAKHAALMAQAERQNNLVVLQESGFSDELVHKYLDGSLSVNEEEVVSALKNTVVVAGALYLGDTPATNFAAVSWPDPTGGKQPNYIFVNGNSGPAQRRFSEAHEKTTIALFGSATTTAPQEDDAGQFSALFSNMSVMERAYVISAYVEGSKS